jgi:ribonuclease Z
MFTSLLKRTSVRQRLLDRVNQMRTAKAQAFSDKLLRPGGFTAVCVGTGTPNVSQRAQPCVAVFVNGRFFLFDAGDGCVKAMGQQDLPIGLLDAVFMTHYHSDHIADLGEVINRSWIMGRIHTLPVLGPEGVAEVVEGFAKAYRLDNIYRNAHHGDEVMPLPTAGATGERFDAPTDGTLLTLFDEDGIVIKTFEANHYPVKPAVGFRIEYGGKILVISGDTLRVAGLDAACQAADLVICDAMNHEIVGEMEQQQLNIEKPRNARFMHDIPDYHIDVHDVGDMAQASGVKHLALVHLMPSVDRQAQIKAFFIDPVAEKYSGKISAPNDGDVFELI